jgi:hypothetical protein
MSNREALPFIRQARAWIDRAAAEAVQPHSGGHRHRADPELRMIQEAHHEKVDRLIARVLGLNGNGRR